ncbi:hypothetical protein NtB2_00858 [Lactococcus termiticola]|uniref:Activator of Hsp90 ATPase homologue 1/2-like C-terminal domain-containing protein n=2 Tax=Lactococcus termiticola TaxID=2169526 RepID=A0A2R5HFB5_9LACT|nr:hypothetical protein NtB2_00858 [Lactococcus termiticola]
MLIKAPTEAVYQSFINPDRIGNFWFSNASATWEVDKEIQLSYEEFEGKVDLRVLDLKENSRIIFEWGPSSDSRVVTIAIKALGPAQSLVEVKEQGFKDFEGLLTDPNLSEILSFEYEDILDSLMGGKAGWTFMLTCLKAYLESGITSLRTGLMP